MDGAYKISVDRTSDSWEENGNDIGKQLFSIQNKSTATISFGKPLDKKKTKHSERRHEDAGEVFGVKICPSGREGVSP